MLRIHMHHRRVGPARRALLRDDRRHRRAVALQQVHLERPRARCRHALVLEVVDLDEGVVPVAADQLPLRAQEVERRVVLLLVQLVGRRDAEFRLVIHQVLRRVGDVDRPVIGLHAACVRLPVGEVHLLEHHVPRGGRRVAEDFGRIHQHVRAPHVGQAVMDAVDHVPRRVLEAGVDRVPGRDEGEVDRLHPVPRDEPQRGVAGGSHEVEAALVHQRHHLVRSVGGLDVDHAAGSFLELGHPVEFGHRLAPLDVAGPCHDIEPALAGANLGQLGRERLRGDGQGHRHGSKKSCVHRDVSP
jgi:hypothetical protein